MSEFTKGPWVITDMGILIQEGGNKHHPIEVAGLNIAHFSDYGERNHRKANAALIASAPDMYEALQIMLTAECLLDTGNPIIRARVDMMKSALAKAEGNN